MKLVLPIQSLIWISITQWKGGYWNCFVHEKSKIFIWDPICGTLQRHGQQSCSLEPRLYLVQITDIRIWGIFFPLILLMAQSWVVSRGALCCQRAPAQICPSSQPCPGNIPWDLSWHPGLALPKCLHSTWSWSASPSAAFMQTNNNIAVQEIPHSKLCCRFFNNEI